MREPSPTLQHQCPSGAGLWNPTLAAENAAKDGAASVGMVHAQIVNGEPHAPVLLFGEVWLVGIGHVYCRMVDVVCDE
jgi:hypothetical protein